MNIFRRWKSAQKLLAHPRFRSILLSLIIGLVSAANIHPELNSLTGYNSLRSNLDYNFNNSNNLLSNPTEWLICGPNSWEDLKNYLPIAKMNGISVQVTLLPPFQFTLVCSQSTYSEPYGQDYIRWAQEIASLSLRYSNFTQFGIYELRENLLLGYLSQDYLDQITTAGKSINPKLQFITAAFDSIAPGVPTNFVAILQNVNVNPNLPLTISPIAGHYQNWWGSNWTSEWGVMTLQGRAIIVENPKYDSVNSSPSVLWMKIDKDDDYTGFVNGSPRAELFRNGYNFNYGKTYKWSFKNYMSDDYKFDTLVGTHNGTMLTQLKQETGVGSPTRCLKLDGNKYIVETYIFIPGGKSLYYYVDIGSAKDDRGKWVNWEVEFKIDSVDGAGHGYFKVRKNNMEVYSDARRTTAYAPYTGAAVLYMKTGMYRDPFGNHSIVDSMVMYRDDIQFTNITDGTSSELTDFGIKSGLSGDRIAHYINLTWTNPSNVDHDSTYIFSSLTANNTTAVKIATVYKTSTTYRDTLEAGTVRYYWLKAKYKNGNVSSFSSVAADTMSVYALNQ